MHIALLQYVAESAKEIADISQRLQHGASVSEICSAYEAHAFPALERIEAQMALLRAVEAAGNNAVVSQVLTDECSPASLDSTDIGFKALVSTLATESYRTEEVMANFHPEDFAPESAKELFAELIQQQASGMEPAQVRKQRFMPDHACVN
jgi:hypothetical protein